ncbi:hypothetical protein ACP70R_047884 [Stipagrostis hirtigluma subsp. patula]
MDSNIHKHAFNAMELRRDGSFQSPSVHGIAPQFYGVGPFGELLAYGNDRGNTMLWPVAPPGSWRFTPMDWQVASSNSCVSSVQFTRAPLPQWSSGTGVFIPNFVSMAHHVRNFTPEAPIRDAGEMCKIKKAKEKEAEETTSTTEDYLAEQIARLPETWIY